MPIKIFPLTGPIGGVQPRNETADANGESAVPVVVPSRIDIATEDNVIPSIPTPPSPVPSTEPPARTLPVPPAETDAGKRINDALAVLSKSSGIGARLAGDQSAIARADARDAPLREEVLGSNNPIGADVYAQYEQLIRDTEADFTDGSLERAAAQQILAADPAKEATFNLAARALADFDRQTQEYNTGVSLSALTAEYMAGQQFTDDPVGKIDWGKLEEITGLTGDQLTGAAIADQKTKLMNAANQEYTTKVLEFQSQMGLNPDQLEALANSSFNDFIAADADFKAQLQALYAPAVSFQVYTGDEEFDTINNKFIDTYRAINEEVLPGEPGSVEYETARVRDQIVHRVMYLTAGAGQKDENGNGAEIPAVDLQSAIGIAMQELEEGKFGELPVTSPRYQSGDYKPAKELAADQAFAILSDAYGGTVGADTVSPEALANSRKVDPNAWNSLKAMNLWFENMATFMTEGDAEFVAQLEQDAANKKVADSNARQAQTDLDVSALENALNAEVIDGLLVPDENDGDYTTEVKAGRSTAPAKDKFTDPIYGAIRGSGRGSKLLGGDGPIGAQPIVDLYRKLKTGEEVEIPLTVEGTSVDYTRPATAEERADMAARLEALYNFDGVQ